MFERREGQSARWVRAGPAEVPLLPRQVGGWVLATRGWWRLVGGGDSWVVAWVKGHQGCGVREWFVSELRRLLLGRWVSGKLGCGTFLGHRANVPGLVHQRGAGRVQKEGSLPKMGWVVVRGRGVCFDSSSTKHGSSIRELQTHAETVLLCEKKERSVNDTSCVRCRFNLHRSSSPISRPKCCGDRGRDSDGGRTPVG